MKRTNPQTVDVIVNEGGCLAVFNQETGIVTVSMNGNEYLTTPSNLQQFATELKNGLRQKALAHV